MQLDFINRFRNPDASYRSIPFWSWDDKITEEEVVRQIGEMKRAGVGGFFIHSRIGLETEYLGRQWMRCVQAAVAEAARCGLNVWLYDEDRWPSGTAGGRVTADDDAYRCKGMALEVQDVAAYPQIYEDEIRGRAGLPDDSPGIAAVFAAVTNGDRLTDLRRIPLTPNQHFDADETLLVFRLLVSRPSPWFNDAAPPDNLNPDCVRRFIRETHERYKAAVGEEFGRTVRGIFTDEPSLHDRHACFGEHQAWIPWTFGYAAYLKDLYGSDFMDRLPYLYYEGKLSAEARHDYWRSITLRYSEAYFHTIGKWCRDNHLLFVGHELQEGKMGLAARVNGAIMPHYRYFDVPGIDLLGKQTGEYLTLKQCTSVANQLGKDTVITETYGATGWEFTLEDEKWIGDWQYVFGINRRCQHQFLYSLRGCRKRDYPPSFNYHNNWCFDNRHVEDYFARLAVALEPGRPVRDILVLHPASTIWSGLGCDPKGNPVRRNERDVPGLDAYGNSFACLVERMFRNHLDFDIGDEVIIGESGTVAGEHFVVGRASYKAVVMSGMRTLLTSTYEHCLDFLDGGGRIYAMAPYPVRIDGREDDGAEALLIKLLTHPHFIKVGDTEELLDRLQPYRSLQVTDTEGHICTDILCQLRKSEKGYVLFLINNSRNRRIEGTVTTNAAGIPWRMDPETGDVTAWGDYVYRDQILRIHFDLEPVASGLFLLLPERRRKLSGPYAITLDSPNVLTLDMCSYRLEGPKEGSTVRNTGAAAGTFDAAKPERKSYSASGNDTKVNAAYESIPERDNETAGGETTDSEMCYSEQMEVWQAQSRIRETLGMRKVDDSELPQRYRWIYQPHAQDGRGLSLRFVFDSRLPLTGTRLVIENRDMFEIRLNEELVTAAADGYFLDRSFASVPLPALYAGRNVIELTCAYRNDMELENIYLIGAFGVDPDRQLTKQPVHLRPGDWTRQGLLHYCGSVTYHARISLSRPDLRLRLALGTIRAAAVKLAANGHTRMIPWETGKPIDLTSDLHIGENTIDITLIGSPRNMLGPLHLKEYKAKTTDGDFCPKKENYSKDYLILPYGLIQEPMILESEDPETRQG